MRPISRLYFCLTLLWVALLAPKPSSAQEVLVHLESGLTGYSRGDFDSVTAAREALGQINGIDAQLTRLMLIDYCFARQRNGGTPALVHIIESDSDPLVRLEALRKWLRLQLAFFDNQLSRMTARHEPDQEIRDYRAEYLRLLRQNTNDLIDTMDRQHYEQAIRLLALAQVAIEGKSRDHQALERPAIFARLDEKSPASIRTAATTQALKALFLALTTSRMAAPPFGAQTGPAEAGTPPPTARHIGDSQLASALSVKPELSYIERQALYAKALNLLFAIIFDPDYCRYTIPIIDHLLATERFPINYLKDRMTASAEQLPLRSYRVYLLIEGYLSYVQGAMLDLNRDIKAGRGPYAALGQLSEGQSYQLVVRDLLLPSKRGLSLEKLPLNFGSNWDVFVSAPIDGQGKKTFTPATAAFLTRQSSNLALHAILDGRGEPIEAGTRLQHALLKGIYGGYGAWQPRLAAKVATTHSADSLAPGLLAIKQGEGGQLTGAQAGSPTGSLTGSSIDKWDRRALGGDYFILPTIQEIDRLLANNFTVRSTVRSQASAMNIADFLVDPASRGDIRPGEGINLVTALSKQQRIGRGAERILRLH